MIKILAIGNSFSQDATAYLHSIADAAGTNIKVVNLYIGGCSLKTHWENITCDAYLYDYEPNGHTTDRKASIKEALLEESWDYVTLQQVSGDSGLIDTFYPYIQKISEYVKLLNPNTTLLLHQTWAYELDSEHPSFINYSRDQQKMHKAIRDTYQIIASNLNLSVIPSGEVIQELRSTPTFNYSKGGTSLCRDGFHMHLIYGRYALAATWYEFILKQSILENRYLPPAMNGEEIDPLKLQLIKETVHRYLLH